jgi:hypothetical protein
VFQVLDSGDGIRVIAVQSCCVVAAAAVLVLVVTRRDYAESIGVL